MVNSKGNTEITDYLKGFAILAVYINHFIITYVTLSLIGYANGFISIFFLLSGFGIYISLKRLSVRQQGKFFLSFFRKRFFRIYPLFWIWCLINGFSNGLLGFFALDIIHPKSPWFIPAIMQCYIIAPFLFIALRNLNVKKSMFIVVGSFILLNCFLFIFVEEPFRSIGYRGLFFNHIFLFCLGFILAKIDSPKTLPSFATPLCVFLFLFFIQETTPQSLINFPGKNIIFPFLFPFSTFMMCYTLLSKKIYLPLKSILQVVGKYTYSIYLFHGVGFSVLVKIGLLEKLNISLTGIIAALILSPLFIFSYSFLEIIVTEFVFGKKDIKNILIKTKEMIYAFKNPFQQITASDSYSTGTS